MTPISHLRTADCQVTAHISKKKKNSVAASTRQKPHTAEVNANKQVRLKKIRQRQLNYLTTLPRTNITAVRL